MFFSTSPHSLRIHTPELLLTSEHAGFNYIELADVTSLVVIQMRNINAPGGGVRKRNFKDPDAVDTAVCRQSSRSPTY